MTHFGTKITKNPVFNFLWDFSGKSPFSLPGVIDALLVLELAEPVGIPMEIGIASGKGLGSAVGKAQTYLHSLELLGLG